MNVLEVAKRARLAALRMATVSGEAKNEAVLTIAEQIEERRDQLKQVNDDDVRDVSLANPGNPSIKRLILDDSKISELTKGLRLLAELDDPVGKTQYSLEMDHGLELYKVTSPIGVIGAIFESRPDALIQIASLCLKSGNSVILKGGVEAARSNQILTELIRSTIGRLGKIPEDSVQLLETREDVAQLLKLDEYVDLLIPRGSSSLVKYVKQNTRIPVLGHAEGICHEYVDVDADLAMAVDICYDSKVQYPTVCNAMNTLLVHRDVADVFLPKMSKKYEDAKVELRADERAKALLPQAKAVHERDWTTEHLDLILNIKIVDSVEDAIDHINRFSTHHTDGIITQDGKIARKFLREVDSSVVIHNASTRFSDGYRFGFGAEVGISTGKIHARGPVGLEGLLTSKYIIAGTGQVVSTYVGAKSKPFTHSKLEKSWNW